MSNFPLVAPPPGFEQLSKEEQIVYVQQLWDIIAAKQEEVSTPQSHIDIVRERITSHEPNKGTPWTEVKQQLLNKYREC
ncbi:MAG: addiction module protein [Calothrix sp. FI2-JRJ7]|jgi:putative addiction module component (TIGR02574 family)|nr:addiction module protein [Calothrix sp. FI2-JRJ7]